MLLLTSTTDALQIVTNSVATIQVHASWVDTNTGTGTITPGRTNTAIAAAVTASVAGAPASGVQRNVKSLHVYNAHATLSCSVTVQHTDGTVVAQLYKRTLNPGDALEYTDQAGFVLNPTSPSLVTIGGGILALVSATQLSFLPYNGKQIIINGRVYTIPSTGTGIAGLANTGVFVNGVAGQNLTVNTVYFVYVFNNGGIVTADFSTTAHATSTTPGNEGTEIKSGDDSRTLIGVVCTSVGATFYDTPQYRYTRSWFNRRRTFMQSPFGAYGPTGSTTWVDTGIGFNFVNFVGEILAAVGTGAAQNSVASNNNFLGGALDGALQGTWCAFTNVNANWYDTVAFQFAVAPAAGTLHYASIYTQVTGGGGFGNVGLAGVIA